MFCAEVYFGRKINALLVFFPVRIVVSGLGHFFASLRAARVSGSIFKLLRCCLEYKLVLPEEVQHRLKNIGFIGMCSADIKKSLVWAWCAFH